MRLELPFQPPLDADALLHHFRARAVAGVEEVVEEVGEHAYRRSLRLAGGAAVVELVIDPLSVVAELELSDPDDADAAAVLCSNTLGLGSDPAVVVAALGDDPLLGAAVRAAPGRRVPGTPDGDELAVRAVLGQQISLAGAAAAAARLVREYGEPLAGSVRPAGPADAAGPVGPVGPVGLADAAEAVGPVGPADAADPMGPADAAEAVGAAEPVGAAGTVTHLFPTAAALASVDPASFRMPRSRARTVHALSSALASGEIVLARGGDPERVRAQLLALPGIGPWTADYVVMRALGDTDVFLATDLGIKRALERLGVDADPASALALAERWRPYRSFAMQYLWALPG
jgi:AraC family transcriptional regulator, regulatory protein of adaptative response / DNA-3-methyladenine glycosylase II